MTYRSNKNGGQDNHRQNNRNTPSRKEGQPYPDKKHGSTQGSSYAKKDDSGVAPRRSNNNGRREDEAQRTYSSRPYAKKEKEAGPPKSYQNEWRKPNNPPDFEAEPTLEQTQPLREDTLPYFLMGRNAVREAIKNDRSIDRILVVPEIDGSLREIINMAKDKNIIVRTTERKRLDELCLPFGHGNKTGNHQGILAMVPDIEYCTVEDILDYAKELSQPPFVLLLDEITDPHNLGSMLRSAACAGVHGVILPKRRSASITAAVAKASAGAVEYVKVAKVSNLNNAIARLKQAGVWIAGADMQGTPMTKSDIRGPLALVVGSEGEGLSRLVRENCDYLISIPMCGKIDSLNASVAAAILMFEKNRQDSL